MILKTKKTLFFSLILLNLFSCRGMGFYEPITLNLEIPPGPPEYQAGWRAGCRSGLSTRSFSGAFVYNQDFGNGIYQHDPNFIKGWSSGNFACVIHAGQFTAGHPARFFPLQ